MAAPTAVGYISNSDCGLFDAEHLLGCCISGINLKQLAHIVVAGFLVATGVADGTKVVIGSLEVAHIVATLGVAAVDNLYQVLVLGV